MSGKKPFKKDDAQFFETQSEKGNFGYNAGPGGMVSMLLDTVAGRLSIPNDKEQACNVLKEYAAFVDFGKGDKPLGETTVKNDEIEYAYNIRPTTVLFSRDELLRDAGRESEMVVQPIDPDEAWKETVAHLRKGRELIEQEQPGVRLITDVIDNKGTVNLVGNVREQS